VSRLTLAVICAGCPSVWRHDFGDQVEPDPAEQAERDGAGTPIPDWRERLVCSGCGSRNIDMVVTGTERR